MQITVSVTVPDYVYQFFMKASSYAQCAPEEIMAEALFLYAEMVSASMIEDMNRETSTPAGDTL